MKKTTILAHWVPLSEGLAAIQSAEVLRRFGINLVILFDEDCVNRYLREPVHDPRCKIKRLQ